MVAYLLLTSFLFYTANMKRWKMTPPPERCNDSGRLRVARWQRHRRGAILVLAAILMVVILGMVAFSVDMGYLVTCRTEMQRSVDAGALAGASAIGLGAAEAEKAARDIIALNPVGRQTVPDASVKIELGYWDPQARAFQTTSQSPSAIRVTAASDDHSTFFGRVLGQQKFHVDAQAIAKYQPRDIMVVLDFSASMNDDSELQQMGKLGRNQIEQNLLQIYNELGAPKFGSMQWAPVSVSGSASSIKNQLGISNVPYPYPAGSWDEYINYVQTDSAVSGAGYRNKYGFLTLVNYWLSTRPKASETPDLWKTSEQPVTAVKDALAVFLAYLQQVKTDDRVGLVIYTYSDGAARLESGLTNDFQLVETTARYRQAGHYDPYTNIGAGMQKARLELEKNGRPGALRMIVLMTDGLANRPGSTSTAQKLVLSETSLAASEGFPVVAISLGSGADTSIMQQIADQTAGVHFNVPGGKSVSAYEEELKKVFRKIADDRPLQLVQ
jgi:Flp pilus assembly protein TadG